MDTFRVRLNCIDHYQAAPTELDPLLWRETGRSSQKTAPQVPIIRVFGATETGQKVCAHIHGAFPYLYLEYDGSLAEADVNAYINTLRLSIDHALAVSYRRNNYAGRAVFVAHVSSVKGVPYFGYHVGYKYFLKVYMLNPSHMTRSADLLHQGAIMRKVFQPYESHLQYSLQFMCDFNLYGCSYIDTNKPHFRSPIPEYSELNSAVHQWHDRSIPDSQVSDQEQFPRQSHCSIEVDICVHDILNRNEVKERPSHHDFIERFNDLGADEKSVNSMAGLWKDETRRRKMRMGITDPGSSPFPPEVSVSMSADPRNTDKGGWIHEDEYRDMIEKSVKDERGKSGNRDINFDSFSKPRPEEYRIQTTSESVEDLFPDRLRRSYATQPGHFDDVKTEHSQVDESTVLRLRDEEDAYESDEEVAREIAMTQKERKTEDSSKRVMSNERLDMDEDETRPDGEEYARQFIDPCDPVNPIAGKNSANSDGEAKLDEVHIPQETVAGSEQSNDVSVSMYERSSKRRKMSATGVIMPMRPEVDPDRSHTRHVPFKVKDTKTGMSLSADLDNEARPRAQVTDVPASSQPLSQDKGQRRLNGNGALSLPVVKNPHDPDSQLRLSQRSDVPGSQKSHKTPSKASSFSGSFGNYNMPGSNAKSASTVTHVRPTVVSEKASKQAMSFTETFGLRPGSDVFLFGVLPPTNEAVLITMIDEGVPPVIYQDAYYSDEKDIPERPREYAGQEFKLESNTVPYSPPFDASGEAPAARGLKPPIVRDKAKEDLAYSRRRRQCGSRTWEIQTQAPAWQEVEAWLQQESPVDAESDSGEVDMPASQIKRKNRPAPEMSQIDGPTQKNKHGFKYSQRHKSTSVQHETQYMSTSSLEVHVNSRGDLAPDPDQDEIACVFWCLQSDDEEFMTDGPDDGIKLGVLALSSKGDFAQRISKQSNVQVEEEDNELDLINRMVDIVRSFDPDILTGYEVHNSSWGYLMERARLKYEFNLADEFSRMKTQSHGRFGKDADRWGFNHTSTIRITGRHMINIWRAMRGELNLSQYTMENVVFHLSHRRIPHYTFADLTRWYKSGRPKDLAKVSDYFVTRVKLDLDILGANELIPRTSEQARLLGVDFFSVFSRGSQFKVESLMFRIAKPESFVLVSPSRKQVGQQNALECSPLVMEPQSAFYSSPSLVLDFQSLYPSVMIAYNYCYSTCLGRVTSWRGQNKMGFTDFKRDPGLLESVKDKLNVAPNGMMYVKPEMRKSLSAKMSGEILETRVMVKSGMKVDKDDKTSQQLLNNRQLASKLIANVTYGYTSASFSGRMPCSEIADSIVQTGRETLEKAIALIHSVERWGAEVVYGDTDSLFVYLKGRTRDQAFEIGNEIAAAVTDMNPRPVKLKFEKVYHPCVSLAKKRYVGFKYEHPNQTEPEFDAKGIETVRRDGTPAEQKIEEKALKILFRTADSSQIKKYFQAQCTKIMTGRFSVQDFCFAKEVKSGTYAERGPPPPGALIATKRMSRDPRLEPQYGERVPYVVIAGAPGARSFERCVEPERLLHDEFAESDAEYYISKNSIPPLERIFNLVGANVRGWYDEMPKVQRVRAIGGVAGDAGKRKTMESYMATSICLVCRTKLPPLSSSPPSTSVPLPLCTRCAADTSRTSLALRAKINKAERKKDDSEKVCRSCANSAWSEEVRCDSRDCPVFYSRVKANTRLGSTRRAVEGVVEAVERREEERLLDW